MPCFALFLLALLELTESVKEANLGPGQKYVLKQHRSVFGQHFMRIGKPFGWKRHKIHTSCVYKASHYLRKLGNH